MATKHRTPWALLALVFATACGDGPPPESALDGYRVLGLIADPPELPPDGQVTLTAVDYDTEGRPATYAWTLCLYSLGSRAQFACIDPALEQALPETGPTATINFGPDGIDFQRRFEAASPLVGLDGEPLTLEEGVDVVVGLTAEVKESRKVVIYKRIRLRTEGTPNQNPSITDFVVPPTVAPDTEVELSVVLSDDSSETYEEASSGRTFTERLLVNFYADGGELAMRGPFDETTTDTTWQTPKEAGPVTLFVAVRDGRGGVAIERRTVQVGP